jgi:hypothetical protein
MNKVAHVYVKAYRELGYDLDTALLLAIEDEVPSFMGGTIEVTNVDMTYVYFNLG